jgi:hypothetical protein
MMLLENDVPTKTALRQKSTKKAQNAKRENDTNCSFRERQLEPPPRK